MLSFPCDFRVINIQLLVSLLPDAPYCRGDPDRRITVARNTSVTLQCDAEAQPSATSYSWVSYTSPASAFTSLSPSQYPSMSSFAPTLEGKDFHSSPSSSSSVKFSSISDQLWSRDGSEKYSPPGRPAIIGTGPTLTFLPRKVSPEPR